MDIFLHVSHPPSPQNHPLLFLQSIFFPLDSAIDELFHFGIDDYSVSEGNGIALASKEMSKTMKRFMEDLASASGLMRNTSNDAIKHMCSPDLKIGRGCLCSSGGQIVGHYVLQEVKLLGDKVDRQSLDSAIDELVHFGMQRCSVQVSSDGYALAQDILVLVFASAHPTTRQTTVHRPQT